MRSGFKQQPMAPIQAEDERMTTKQTARGGKTAGKMAKAGKKALASAAQATVGLITEVTRAIPATSDTASADEAPAIAQAAGPAQERKTMNVTFTRSDAKRRSNMIVFAAPEGHRGSVRVSKSLFAKDSIPQELTLENPALAEPRKPREAMTAEERKAARKAQPKLTPAEKVAKLEQRLANARRKLQQGAQAEQPAATM
jgi:hypothetical protein